jgi:hypothetical protein
MVLDIIGDLFTHGRQLKHLVLDDGIVGLLGKLPILGCLVPEIVSPIHVVQSNEPGVVTANAWPKAVRVRPRHDNIRTGLVQGGEIKPRQAAYGDGVPHTPADFRFGAVPHQKSARQTARAV